MKKRIGTKIYDTDKAECILPEKNLYKQQKNRTFFIYDGTVITPLTFEEASEIIRAADDPELEKVLNVKPDIRGCTNIGITMDHYTKLADYARKNGRSMKSIIEQFIDSLPE